MAHRGADAGKNAALDGEGLDGRAQSSQDR
jgi:hypothetical protein